MQDLLKDHFVERVQSEARSLSLTCSVCGAVWSSNLPIGTDIESAVAEAMDHNKMCPFCGRPVCLNCLETVEDLSLCVQCDQKLRKKLEQK